MQILAESELLKEQFKEEADLDLEKLLQSEESIDLIIEKLIYFRDNGFAEILFEFIFNIINEYSKIKKEKKYSNEKIENMGKLYGLIIKKVSLVQKPNNLPHSKKQRPSTASPPAANDTGGPKALRTGLCPVSNSNSGFAIL